MNQQTETQDQSFRIMEQIGEQEVEVVQLSTKSGFWANIHRERWQFKCPTKEIFIERTVVHNGVTTIDRLR